LEVEFEESLSSDFARCISCGGCNIPCPLFNLDRIESSGMRSRIKILSMLSKGKIELTEGILRHIFACANCGICNNYCPVGLRPFDLLVKARDSLIDMGYVPLVTVDIRDSFRKVGTPIADELIKGSWLPPDFQPTRNSEILFFAGCWMHKAIEVALNTMKILGRISGSITTIGPGEPCSGALLYILGEKDLANDAKRNLESVISELSPKRVVSGCPLTVRVYPDLGLMKISSYVLDAIRSEKMRIGKVRGKDTILPIPSCGSDSSFLEVLRSFNNLKILETPEWLCCDCGFTLIYRTDRGLFSKWVQRVLSLAEELGANHIVIEDVGCYAMIMEVMQTRGRLKGIKISHMSGFIMEFLK
jgi:glycolate oxidase iron-sulfur subunit